MLLSCCIVSSSCKTELKLPDIRAQEKIVLLGELTAGDSIFIRGGQSIPVAAGSSMKFRIPEKMQIVIRDGSGQQVTLYRGYDSWVSQLFTLPFSSPMEIRANTVYSLIAEREGSPPASCQVIVPAPFTATIRDTASVWVNGLSLLRMQIEIEDDGNATNYYTIEGVKEYLDVEGRFAWEGKELLVSQHRDLYDSLKQADSAFIVTWDTTRPGNAGRIYIYTDDERAENLKIGNAQSASRRILLSDKTINGQTYTTQVYLDKSLLTASDGSKGLISIRIKSVSADYFAYLKGYEQFEAFTDFNALPQPVRIKGNVENGLGVIGGVYLVEFQYLFDRWD